MMSGAGPRPAADSQSVLLNLVKRAPARPKVEHGGRPADTPRSTLRRRARTMARGRGFRLPVRRSTEIVPVIARSQRRRRYRKHSMSRRDERVACAPPRRTSRAPAPHGGEFREPLDPLATPLHSREEQGRDPRSRIFRRIETMQQIIGILRARRAEKCFAKVRRRSPSLVETQNRAQRLANQIECAAFVAHGVTPAARASRLPCGISSIGDRTSPAMAMIPGSPASALVRAMCASLVIA